jgi:hypothetical protein
MTLGGKNFLIGFKKLKLVIMGNDKNSGSSDTSVLGAGFEHVDIVLDEIGGITSLNDSLSAEED